MKFRAFRLLALSGMIAAVVVARAQSYVWSGAGDGLPWTDPRNWIGGVAPASFFYNNYLYFGPDRAGRVDSGAGKFAMRSLEMYGGYALTGGTLGFAGGGTLHTGGGYASVSNDIALNDDTQALFKTSTELNVQVDSYYTYLYGVVSGNGALRKTGGGGVVLLGKNTYAGPTIVQEGYLVLGTDGTLPVGDVAMTGGRFELNGHAQTVRNLAFGDGSAANVGSIGGSGGLMTLTGGVTFNGRADGSTPGGLVEADVALSAGTHAFGDNGNRAANGGPALAFTGSLSGAGGIVKTGSSAMTISGTSSYTGGTRIEGGSLSVSNLVGDYVVDGALGLNSVADTTYGGTISGKGSFTLAGQHALTLTAPLTQTGGTVVVGSVLRLTESAPLPVGRDLTLAYTPNTYKPSSLTFPYFGQNSTQTVGRIQTDFGASINGGTLVVSEGVIQMADSYLLNLVKTGPGTLRLGNSDYPVITNVYARGGTLTLMARVATDANFGTAYALQGGDLNVYTFSGEATPAASITFGDGTMGGNLGQIRRELRRSDRLLIQSTDFGGSRGYILYNGNADHTSLPTSIAADLTLGMNEGYNIYDPSGFVANPTRISGNGNRSSGDVDVTISGAIDGATPNAGLLKESNSIYRLTGPTQYTGGTSVQGGTLIVEQPAGGYRSDADLRFDVGGAVAIASIFGNGDVTKTGDGTLTVGGTMGNVGRIDVLGGSVAGAGKGVYAGAFTLGSDAEFVNLSGGTIEFAKAATIQGSFTTTRRSTTVFDGLVTGAGNFDGLGTVTFKGGYAPGNSPASVEIEGRMVLADSNDLVMELGGTTLGSGYDHLTLDSLASLGGALDVRYYGGFRASAGQSFDLFDWDGGLTGRFSSVRLPGLGDGLAWDTGALYTTGVISVQAVPEPSAFAALGLGALALRRRRR